MVSDDYVLIGKIVSTFGLKGGVKVSTSGDILEVLQEPIQLFLDLATSPIDIKTLKLEKFWKAGNLFIFIIEGFSTIEDTEALVGRDIYVQKEKIPQDSDGFFIYQLIGLYPKSNNIQYKEFKIVEVMDNPAHPILKFVGNDNREVLIPFVDRFVGEINIKEGFAEIFDWADFF